MHAIEGNGYHLDIACMEHDGTICHVDEKEAVASIRDASRLVWMNIVVKDDEAVRRLLQDEMKFHELAVEDSLSDNERPTLQEFGNHLFVAASKVIEHPGQPEEYVEVGMFLTKSALVTVVRQPLPFLHEWFVRYEKKKHVFGEAAAFLMHSIIDNIVDEYFVAIDALEDEVDALAEDIYQGDTKGIGGILIFKKRLLDMRRHISPTRDILNGLLRHDLTLVPDSARVYFQDVYDHTLRIAEIADVNRDTLTSLLDVHLSTVSNNLNNVMKKMTVISTVLMSAALIAGIYGMNFKFMPELEWHYGYLYAWVLMIGSGIAILLLFRWKKWL